MPALCQFARLGSISRGQIKDSDKARDGFHLGPVDSMATRAEIALRINRINPEMPDSKSLAIGPPCRAPFAA